MAFACLRTSSSLSEYEHSWVDTENFGDFNSAITLAMYSPQVRTVSSSQVFVVADEDLRVTIDGSMTYAHTPGDDTGIDFGISVRDTSTNEFLFQESQCGGNLYLLPAAGTLPIAGEAILSAGTIYRLSFTVDARNTGDLPPTGIFDANGFVHFSVEPLIPEPATACLLMAAAPMVLRVGRTRR